MSDSTVSVTKSSSYDQFSFSHQLDYLPTKPLQMKKEKFYCCNSCKHLSASVPRPFDAHHLSLSVAIDFIRKTPQRNRSQQLFFFLRWLFASRVLVGCFLNFWAFFPRSPVIVFRKRSGCNCCVYSVRNCGWIMRRGMRKRGKLAEIANRLFDLSLRMILFYQRFIAGSKVSLKFEF